MIDITAEYGFLANNAIQSHREYLEFLINHINSGKVDESKFIAIFSFDTSAKQFTIEKILVSESNKEEIAKNILWVGNTPNVTNRFISTNNNDRYVLGIQKDKEKGEINHNTPQELLKFITNYSFHSVLEHTIKNFFPESLHYHLDFVKSALFPEICSNLFQAINNYKSSINKKDQIKAQKQIKGFMTFLKKNEIESFISSISNVKEFENYIIENLINNESYQNNHGSLYLDFIYNMFGINRKDITLVTMKIDGELVAENLDYIDFLYSQLTSKNQDSMKKSKKNSSNEKVCSICGVINENVNADHLKKAQIKFFNSDKIIFSQGLTNNFDSNFALCEKCILNVILGEKFILNYFNKKWAKQRLLILPEIHPMNDLNSQDLNFIRNESMYINEVIYKFHSASEVEDLVLELIDRFENHSLMFHYIFYNQDQAGRLNKIYKMVRDVPPTRLKIIISALNQIEIEDVIKSKNSIGLASIYYAIPQKIDSKTKDAKGKTIFLDVFDSIFHKTFVPKVRLLEDFTRTIQIMIQESKNFNVSLKASDLSTGLKKWKVMNKILQMNMIIQFLESINSIERSQLNVGVNQNMSEDSTSELKTEIDKYWQNKSIYKQNQTRSLFLLGILTAEVGNAQAKKLSNAEPILKKINFDGMSHSRLIQFADMVNGLLGKYKSKNGVIIRQFNQDTIYEFYSNFESVSEEDWNLGPAENVFYLMSGYAFKKKYNKVKFGQEENENELEDDYDSNEEESDDEE